MALGLQTINIDFEKLEEIGQEGKNSKVYRSNDLQLGALRAIKVIEKSKFSNINEYYEEAQKIEAAAHPHVIQVKCAGYDADHICILMPYYGQGSLKKLVQAKTLTVREIIKYSIDFLSGLQHLHDQGFIHFDVKLDNIMIDDIGNAILSDFGLTKNFTASGTAQPAQLYGKQLPPEALRPPFLLTIKADIYMSGGAIHRMCVGIDVVDKQFDFLIKFKRFERELAGGAYPERRLKAYPAHIPTSLALIIRKAMHVNPDLRYVSALEMSNALANITELLDWRYDPANLTWTLDQDERTYVVKAINTGTTYRIETIRTMKNSGKTTRMHDHCIDNIAPDKLKETVQASLLELEK